ncbi:MAG: anthranilate synthase component II [Eubacteriales bacterium]
MIVIIDNYDSFTYNLYQFVGEIDENVTVYRNDAIHIEKLKQLKPHHIIISPGPGYPHEAGISKQVIELLGENIPLLGVCLGHQAIGEVFGGNIIEATKMFHGKTSMIMHHEKNLFKNITNPLRIMRYHSLIIENETLSQEIEVTATTLEGEIMSIQHKSFPIYGVQFHPESIMTESGREIISNFLKI